MNFAFRFPDFLTDFFFVPLIGARLMILVSLILFALILWQAYVLMATPESQFNGPYDKILWLVIILFVPFGCFLFMIWNSKSKHVIPSSKVLSRNHSTPEVGAEILRQEQNKRLREKSMREIDS